MHPYSTDSLSGLSVDSPAFRQRAPHVQLSDDPDTATQQTVQEMCRQIHQAASDPLVQQCALNAVQRFRGGPLWARHDIAANPQALAESCWWWCKHALRFKHHGSMFEAWSSDLGDPQTKLQLLIAPDVLVRMKTMAGDCAIYTMMLCAMLEALGLRWEICTAAVDRTQPTIFSHVWPRLVLPDGRREPLDASHGTYPGWQVPSEDLQRVWVFDQNGARVAGDDGAPSRFGGLHAYRRRSGRRGMGAMVCDETGFCYDDGTGGATAPTTTPDLTYAQLVAAGNPACTCVNGTCLESGNSCSSGPATTTVNGVPGYTAPSQSSAQWASFATALLKSGLTLAEINAIQPGTVVSANGAILRQSTGYAVGSTTGTLNLGGISTNTLMVAGLILAGILIMSMKGGR